MFGSLLAVPWMRTGKFGRSASVSTSTAWAYQTVLSGSGAGAIVQVALREEVGGAGGGVDDRRAGDAHVRLQIAAADVRRPPGRPQRPAGLDAAALGVEGVEVVALGGDEHRSAHHQRLGEHLVRRRQRQRRLPQPAKGRACNHSGIQSGLIRIPPRALVIRRSGDGARRRSPAPKPKPESVSAHASASEAPGRAGCAVAAQQGQTAAAGMPPTKRACRRDAPAHR